MKRSLKITAISLGIVILLAGLWVTNAFIYPFTSSNPNYSDVERAFAKLQFPSEWQEIKSTENRGLHGRGCDPLNSSGCFSKSKTFKVAPETSNNDVAEVLKTAGCTGVVTNDISYGDDSKPSTSFSCSTGNSLTYVASLSGPRSEVYVGANSY